MIRVNENKNGLKNLHIWRTGLSYTKQKGALYRAEWTNLYFSLLPQPPEEKHIHYYDVRKPLPFADNTFDNMYAMHVIEHLSPKEGLAFVKELHRVLRPKGICRLSTPDLEDIVRHYVKIFKKCVEQPTEENLCNYHWAQLEMFDQMVRMKSGGEMIDAIKAGYFKEDYLKERYGDVYAEFDGAKAERLRADIRAQRLAEMGSNGQRSLLTKIRDRIERKVYEKKLRETQQYLNWDPRKILEVNKWMYDRLSLGILMKNAGLVDYCVKDHQGSDIVNWERYQFDRSDFGDHAIEPSLYAEARKP